MLKWNIVDLSNCDLVQTYPWDIPNAIDANTVPVVARAFWVDALFGQAFFYFIIYKTLLSY